MGPFIVVVGGITLLAVLAFALALKNLLYVCEPNEVLIFSGRRRQIKDFDADTKDVGYRVLRGGRSMRVPLIEKVYKLDLTNMVIPLSIRNAYSKGGIPLNVDAVANVKISGQEPILNYAIERMLGKSRQELMRIAKETLEGNLRGVLATLTPEQANEDKAKFQQNLVEEAEQDLKRLGLVLDTLNIQNISDDRGYLNSIGRKQAAEVRKAARIKEAESHATSAVRSAENDREKAIAQIEADIRTAKAEAERRIIDATTQRAAVIAEQESEIAALIARATAEVKVQQQRIEQVRRKLEADVLRPAEANMKASIEDAKGRAAKIIEEGEATANALRAVTETWKRAGDNARDIFLLQKVDVLMKQVLETVHDLKIDRLTILPTGKEGQNGNLSSNLLSTSEQIKAALGVDLPELINNVSQNLGDKDKGVKAYGE